MGGLTIGISNLEMFIVIKTFPGLQNTLQDYGVFYMYSTACIFAAIFVHFFIEDNENVKVSLKNDCQNYPE